MPPVRTLESLVDPKMRLCELLLDASELTGRKRQRFRPHEKIYRVAELIVDFGSLRQLEAFRAFETRLSTALQAVPR